MTLGERVRRIRTELPGKVTQTEFAEMLGVSRGEIANIEGDVLKKPSGKMPLLLLICTKFNVREDWLLHEDGPMRHPEPDADMAYLNALLSGDDAETIRFIKKFLRTYTTLPAEDQRVIDNLIHTLLNEK